MKKIILIVMLLILFNEVYAQSNLDINLGIDQRKFYPNEKVGLNLSIINREISFFAQEVTVSIKVSDRYYEYKVGDLEPSREFSKQIILPEFPPGTHTIYGIVNSTGFLGEIFSTEIYNSFEVLYPLIQRYPRHVNIIGFELPNNLSGGEEYEVKIVVKNEGKIGGDMFIQVVGMEEYVEEQVTL